MKRLILITVFLFVLIFSKNVFASVKINEIYPAPLTGEFEWVELYNDEDKLIDLLNYTLTDATNKKIKLNSDNISPFGFIIATSSGVLNNDGDTVILKNNLNEQINIATYSGTFTAEKSYVNCLDGSDIWFTLNTITKNASNQTACLALTPTIIPTLEPTPTTGSDDPTPTETLATTPTPYPLQPTTLSFDNIYISEVMVNPPTGEKEWVEIYNDNDFSVSLNNWYIDDQESAGSSPKLFSLEINAKSYGVFNLSSSIFNNDGDSVRLLDFNKDLKDDFEYQKTEQGKSLGRVNFDSDDFCFQEPSKNSVNNPCINSASTILSTIDSADPTPKIEISPTTKSALTNKPVSINRLIDTNIIIIPTEKSGTVLGTSDEIMINSFDNKPLINLLTILSTSYSLLTISSILFKMKLSYGKDKNFYSSTLRPS